MMVLFPSSIMLALACAKVVATDQLPLVPESDKSSLETQPASHTDGNFEHVILASLPDYRIRVRRTENWCDPNVKQYSGYLDVSKNKHLFFWFFESRKDPHKAPLAAWMNGGPGGSSGLGLLMEHGPCNVVSDNATTRNPYAWNEVANMIYLDQPAGVGYSYSTSSHIVDTTWEAAKDFYAFVQLFLKCFPEYSDRPFHVLSESYGGQYAPNFANYINRQNKANRALAGPAGPHINLESVVIINGQVWDLHDESKPEFACAGPYAFWDNDGEHCKMLRSRIPRLHELVQQCRDFGTPLTCIPAAIYSFTALSEGFEKLGRSMYDVRKPCTELFGCYSEMNWAQNYLNRSDVKVALGVPASYNYIWFSKEMNLAFIRAGDVTNDATPMIRELLEDGVRVLNLAGDADFACNYMGTFQWMYELDSPFKTEFRSLDNTIWKNKDGKAIGEVRAAGSQGGKTAGNFTWLRVYEAGHMVPHDQPEACLEFFTKWLENKPLA